MDVEDLDRLQVQKVIDLDSYEFCYYTCSLEEIDRPHFYIVFLLSTT